MWEVIKERGIVNINTIQGPWKEVYKLSNKFKFEDDANACKDALNYSLPSTEKSIGFRYSIKKIKGDSK